MTHYPDSEATSHIILILKQHHTLSWFWSNKYLLWRIDDACFRAENFYTANTNNSLSLKRAVLEPTSMQSRWEYTNHYIVDVSFCVSRGCTITESVIV